MTDSNDSSSRPVVAGYYIIGVAVGHAITAPLSGGEVMFYPGPDTPWSISDIDLLVPGHRKTYQRRLDVTCKGCSIHAWGFCRIVEFHFGTFWHKPENGELFVQFSKVGEPGCCLSVTLEAFEPFTIPKEQHGKDC